MTACVVDVQWSTHASGVASTCQPRSEAADHMSSPSTAACLIEPPVYKDTVFRLEIFCHLFSATFLKLLYVVICPWCAFVLNATYLFCGKMGKRGRLFGTVLMDWESLPSFDIHILRL